MISPGIDTGPSFDRRSTPRVASAHALVDRLDRRAAHACALDPVLRLILTRAFAHDLDAHVQTEFPLLRDLLRRRKPPARSPRAPETER